MYHKYRLLIHAAITALIMAFIFYQSSLPAILSSEMSGHLEWIVAWILGKPSESVTFAVRKAAHVTEFAALGMSLFYTVRDFLEREKGQEKAPVSKPGPSTPLFPSERMRKLFLPWICGTLYAVSDEIHQLFVEGRSCELRDMLIDSAGVAAGVLLANWIAHRRRRNTEEQIKG
jgi:VanZ family protein